MVHAPRESLMSYVNQFNQEMVAIIYYNVSTAPSTFKRQYFTSGMLYMELKKYSTRTIADATEKANANIKWEVYMQHILPVLNMVLIGF